MKEKEFKAGDKVVYTGSTVEELKGLTGKVLADFPNEVSCFVSVDWGKPVQGLLNAIPPTFLRKQKE